MKSLYPSSFYRGFKWAFGSGIKVFQPTINKMVVAMWATHSASGIISLVMKKFQADIEGVPIFFRWEIKYKLSFMVLDAVNAETDKRREERLNSI